MGQQKKIKYFPTFTRRGIFILKIFNDFFPTSATRGGISFILFYFVLIYQLAIPGIHTLWFKMIALPQAINPDVNLSFIRTIQRFEGYENYLYHLFVGGIYITIIAFSISQLIDWKEKIFTKKRFLTACMLFLLAIVPFVYEVVRLIYN